MCCPQWLTELKSIIKIKKKIWVGIKVPNFVQIGYFLRKMVKKYQHFVLLGGLKKKKKKKGLHDPTYQKLDLRATQQESFFFFFCRKAGLSSENFHEEKSPFTVDYSISLLQKLVN